MIIPIKSIYHLSSYKFTKILLLAIGNFELHFLNNFQFCNAMLLTTDLLMYITTP